MGFSRVLYRYVQPRDRMVYLHTFWHARSSVVMANSTLPKDAYLQREEITARSGTSEISCLSLTLPEPRRNKMELTCRIQVLVEHGHLALPCTISFPTVDDVVAQY